MKKKQSQKDICPICGSDRTGELYPSNVDIKKLSFTYVKTPESNRTFRSVRCLNCTHVFCSPLPPNLYKNYEDVVDREYLNYLVSITISSRLILPQIKQYVGKTVRLLDVGCATGEFLDVAKKFGYKVEGLELSRWSSRIAEKKGITVHKKLLKNLASQYPGRYDCITLFGVIEHFEKPYEELKYIEKLLKPGGVLVIWTGDVESISSKILKKNWWYWQGQHIQYFSRKSLDMLGIRVGIEPIAQKTYPFVATRDLLDNSLSRYGLRRFIMMLADPFFKVKPTWTFYIPGEMLWFGRKAKRRD